MYIDLVNLSIYLNDFPNRTFEKTTTMPGSGFPFYRLSTIYNKNHSLMSGKNILDQGVFMGQVYWNAMPLRRTIFNIGI
jgi:hypothetical protein